MNIETSTSIGDDKGYLKKPLPVDDKELKKQKKAERDAEEATVRYIMDREEQMLEVFNGDGHAKRYSEAEKLMNEHLNVDTYTAGFAYMGVRDVSQKLRPPEYDIQPKSKDKQFAARVMYEAIQNELDKCKFRFTFIEDYWNACVYGENFRFIHFHNSDIDGYKGISLESVKPTNILIDERHTQFTSSTGRGDAVDMVVKYTYSYEDFKHSFRDYDNIDRVKPGAIRDSATGNNATYVDVWVYYNRVQDKEIIIAGGDRTIIKVSKLMTRIGKRKVLPCVQIRLFKIAGSNRFQGIPTLIKNLNKMKNDGIRLGAQHAKDMGKPVTIINSASEIDRDALARRDPFVEVFVPQGADPNSLFMQHQLNPLGAEFYNLVIDTLNNEAVARIGSDFNTFSQEAKHASTQIQRNEYTDSMVRRLMEYNELQSEADFIKMVGYIMIDYFDDKKWQELLDLSTYEELKAVSKAFGSIKKYLDKYFDGVDVAVSVGSIVDPNVQSKKQQLTEALQVTQPQSPFYNTMLMELYKVIAPHLAAQLEMINKQAQQMPQQIGQTANGGNATAANGGMAQGQTDKGSTTQEVVQRAIQPKVKEVFNTGGGTMA